MTKEKATIPSIIGGAIVLIALIQYASENPEQAKDTIDDLCSFSDHVGEFVEVAKSLQPEEMDEKTIKLYGICRWTRCL